MSSCPSIPEQSADQDLSLAGGQNPVVDVQVIDQDKRGFKTRAETQTSFSDI